MYYLYQFSDDVSSGLAIVEKTKHEKGYAVKVLFTNKHSTYKSLINETYEWNKNFAIAKLLETPTTTTIEEFKETNPEYFI